MEFTPQQLKEKYESLPGDIKSAIRSVAISQKITELAKKYRLHIDKAEELSDETGLVMLGLTKPQDYLNNLKRRLELPEDMARDLVADVNEQIFKPIRESLKSIHGMASANPQPAVSSAPNLNHTESYREAITDEDLKILADHGMELVTDNGDEQPAPSVVEPAERPENRIEITKEDGAPGKEGAQPKNIPFAPPVPSPSGKLTSVIKTPPTEATYTPINNTPPVPVSERAKQASDPYREPVS